MPEIYEDLFLHSEGKELIPSMVRDRFGMEDLHFA